MGSLAKVVALSTAIAIALAAAPVGAADPLAEQLIRLRGEVEQLNSELELLREEQRSTLQGLGAQKAELSASVDRQQLAARDAQNKLDQALAEASQQGAGGDQLSPVLLAAIAQLEAQIGSGLPFKRDERQAELASLRADLQNGSLQPARAANRLWAFYEDEIRLTRETGIYNQTIDVEGTRVLAEVAKVGAMALYFRTPDGRYGQAVANAGRWHYLLAPEVEQQKRIGALFEALRKQIRQGLFELPLLAPQGAAA